MNQVARTYTTVGATLATAASLVAAAPVVTAPELRDLQVPAVQLTGTSDELATFLQGINDTVINVETPFNAGLTTGQVNFEQLIFGGDDSALNGIVNRGYNVYNMFLDAVERSFNGLLGAQVDSEDPLSITQSLTVGLAPLGGNVFDSGDIGGLEGMFGQGLQLVANVIGFPTSNMMSGLEQAMIGFNQGLVQGELALNHTLIIAESDIDHLLGGNALNGAVNQMMNVFNMYLDAGEQYFNGLIGAHAEATSNVYQTITGSLLLDLNNPTDPFADGTIGGLGGALGHGYMAFADLVGWFLGDT